MRASHVVPDSLDGLTFRTSPDGSDGFPYPERFGATTMEGTRRESVGGSKVGLHRYIIRLVVVVAMVVSGLVLGSVDSPAESQETYPMIFPVVGDVTYRDTWGAPRSGGRTHEGTDIFAPKGTPVVAAAPGTVVRITVGERAGRYIVVEHFDGWRTYYLHLDNDTPGTDDGLGGAPAEGIAVGVRVEAGQILDFVGDSGNAEGTPPHLHFELHPPGEGPINPYPHLRAAQTTEVDFDAPRPTVKPRGPDMTNTELVGSFDPGGGFTA
ncbi:MAG: M23 family metallopeptidase, partial [Acidimicrobiia bacterium]|nr:M23 family metallopeptidase [Acidimicrobiia bacterium]